MFAEAVADLPLIRRTRRELMDYTLPSKHGGEVTLLTVHPDCETFLASCLNAAYMTQADLRYWKRTSRLHVHPEHRATLEAFWSRVDQARAAKG